MTNRIRIPDTHTPELDAQGFSDLMAVVIPETAVFYDFVNLKTKHLIAYSQNGEIVYHKGVGVSTLHTLEAVGVLRMLPEGKTGDKVLLLRQTK